jgi:hypothetical protein
MSILETIRISTIIRISIVFDFLGLVSYKERVNIPVVSDLVVRYVRFSLLDHVSIIIISLLFIGYARSLLLLLFSGADFMCLIRRDN